MDVPRVDSAQLRLASAQMVVDTALDLVRGDRFAATVVAVHEAGEVVLATPRGSFISQTDVRLAPGQSLLLEVMKGGHAPMLRIVDGAFHFDEQAFAEAVIDAVRRHLAQDRHAGRLGSTNLEGRHLAHALRAHVEAPGAPLTPEQRAAAARLLAAVDPRAPTAEIAEHLRVLIENGGTLLEPRLRGAVGQTVAGELPADVRQDLRVVLAALLKAGADDTARAEARQRLSAQLAANVLDRQLDQALQWVKHGTLVADVPITDRRDEGVRMRYHRDHRDGDRDTAAPAHAVHLAFDVDALGRLDVDVTWAHGRATVRVRTDDAAAQTRVLEGVTDLRRALRGRGLALDHVEVVVDAPVGDTADGPGEPPPAGSILRLVG